MGTTLENGIYLPDEGERNCYDGLAGNWVALDNHLGSTDIHVTINDKQAWNGHVADTTIHVTSADKQVWNGHVADTTIHVTSADKQAWNGHIADSVKHVTAEDKAKWNTVTSKADASALTAHTGDTTIHVTAEDKRAWNEHVADTVKHVTASDKQTWNGKQDALSQTQLDAVNSGIDSSKVQQIATNTSDISSLQSGKANDSDVVHKSGNEDVNGTKTFKDMIPIDGDYLGNEANTNQRTNICLRSNRDTADKSCAYITRFRHNRPQGALGTSDLHMIGFDVLENEVRTNNVLSIQCTNWLNDIPQRVNFVSYAQSYSFGRSSNKALINDLSPGALSLPDLNNGIDISSYITNFDRVRNKYTPPDNGYILITVRKTTLDHISIRIQQTDGLMNSSETTDFSTWGTYLPVVAGNSVEIYIYADALASAKFYPCQGNI